jgi:hypothetical protein
MLFGKIGTAMQLDFLPPIPPSPAVPDVTAPPLEKLPDVVKLPEMLAPPPETLALHVLAFAIRVDEVADTRRNPTRAIIVTIEDI